MDTPNPDVELENELIRRVAAGDNIALMALYDRHNRQAFGLAFRILGDAATAEEVVQDAFLSLWRNAKSFDTGRGGVRTWLLTIVHNRSIDRIRAAKSRASTVELEIADYAGIASDPWDDVTDRLDGAQVREAVAELPEDQRSAIELGLLPGPDPPGDRRAHRPAPRHGQGPAATGLRKLASRLAPEPVETGSPGDRAGPADT